MITADGRPHLRLTDRRYDIIVVDAYKQPYIPFYLATREFFELTRERLTPDGIVALNVATVPDDDRLSRAIASTLLAEYPQVWRWKPLRFNELQLGYNTPTSRDELIRRAERVHPDVAVLGELFARGVVEAEVTERALTDDRAPVEWLTDQAIASYIADGGGGLDEDFLPTRP